MSPPLELNSSQVLSLCYQYIECLNFLERLLNTIGTKRISALLINDFIFELFRFVFSKLPPKL